VKEIKPHEERFFKDIVLKSILEEISNEQEKPLQDLIPTKPQRYTKTQIAFLSFLSASVIVLAVFLIPLTMKVTKPVQATQYAALQTDKQESKKTTDIQEKKLTELKIQAKDDSLLIVSQNSAKTSIGPTQLSEHEIAKAQLLEQMKN
jgi:hypothetical protein